MSEPAPTLEFRHVSCARDGMEVRDVSLCFTPHSSILVMGDSGVELLLRLASLQERPDGGEILLNGQSTHTLDEASFATLRGRSVGLVFPAAHLLPGLSAVENVAVPLFKLLALETAEAAERTHTMLDFVGLRGDPGADVLELSRADQQRVALARALVHRPSLLVLNRAEDALVPDEATEFRETVRRACLEFGVLALATLSAAPIGYGAHRFIIVEEGIASDPHAPAQP